MDPVTNTQPNPQEHVITIYTPSTIPPNPNPNPNPRSTTTTNTTNTNPNSGTGTGTYNRNRRSPLNSGLWISIEVIVNVSQIIAAIVVLSLSRKEKPKAPLFQWVIGYTVGCFATLPHLYWRYIHRNVNNNNNNLNSNNNGQEAVRNNDIGQLNDMETGANNTHNNNNMNHNESSNNNSSNNSRDLRERQLNVVTSNPRINALFDHFKMALDCFFAVWFVVGNVWIFGTHSTVADAPILYRLCIVFLTFSCIGYAMPFILCGVICCCLPCIISVMGFREDPGAASARGASPDSINALPTYKFKAAKKARARAAEREAGQEGGEGGGGGAGVGGVFAPGTDKEKILSAEDAVCCICLGKYANNDELRELPCAHFFHKDCVDKWLKINALCPLCKAEVGNTNNQPSSSAP